MLWSWETSLSIVWDYWLCKWIFRSSPSAITHPSLKKGGKGKTYCIMLFHRTLYVELGWMAAALFSHNSMTHEMTNNWKGCLLLFMVAAFLWPVSVCLVLVFIHHFASLCTYVGANMGTVGGFVQYSTISTPLHALHLWWLLMCCEHTVEAHFRELSRLY